MDRRASSGRQIIRLQRPVFMVSPCHSPKRWRQRESPSILSRRATSAPTWFALLNPRCWRQLSRASQCGVWGNPLKLRRLSRGLPVTKPALQRVLTSLLTAACTWDNAAVRQHAPTPVKGLKGFVAKSTELRGSACRTAFGSRRPSRVGSGLYGAGKEMTSRKTKIRGYSACVERTTTKTSLSRWRLRRWPELLAEGFLRRQWDTSRTST